MHVRHYFLPRRNLSIRTFLMTTIAPDFNPISTLDSDAKHPESEAASDLKDAKAFPVERDCLCGIFSPDDKLFAMPAKAVKSRW